MSFARQILEKKQKTSSSPFITYTTMLDIIRVMEIEPYTQIKHRESDIIRNMRQKELKEELRPILSKYKIKLEE